MPNPAQTPSGTRHAAPNAERDDAPLDARVGAADPKTAHFGDWFTRFAKGCSLAAGKSWAFTLAIAAVVIWALLGPRYHYSDTWQLVINTATTIITFIMVFLIQNTQNRDSRAIHLKLDEIIRSIHEAHNELIDVENLSDQELEKLSKRYERLRAVWEERRGRKQHADKAA
jgi:low affinity Fe/Cu permease